MARAGGKVHEVLELRMEGSLGKLGEPIGDCRSVQGEYK